jgi:hypothetical protein
MVTQSYWVQSKKRSDALDLGLLELLCGTLELDFALELEDFGSGLELLDCSLGLLDDEGVLLDDETLISMWFEKKMSVFVER